MESDAQVAAQVFSFSVQQVVELFVTELVCKLASAFSKHRVWCCLRAHLCVHQSSTVDDAGIVFMRNLALLSCQVAVYGAAGVGGLR